jgi:signal transduction histidine kinase
MIREVIGRSRKPPLVLILVAVLLILLPLLAYLQYQWLGQVSANEREQMQENLRRATAQFSQDFNREIVRIYTAFEYSPRGGLKPAELNATLRSDGAALFTRWKQVAPYPALVGDVYLAFFDGADRPVLERLDASTKQFSAIDWPAELIRFRNSINAPVVTANSKFAQIVKIPAGPIDARIPAIFVGVLNTPPVLREPQAPHPPPGAEVFTAPQPVAHFIIKLNFDYIQKEFLPALIRQHLTIAGRLDYNVAILDREEPERVIYSTTEMTHPDIDGDATVSLFALTPFEFFSFPAPGSIPPHDRIRAKVPGDRFEVRVGRFGWAKQIGAAKLINSDSGAWQLVATHRAGSVDAAVAQLRLRNLAISFGILVLLTLSIAIILISLQRERRLAMQQLDFVSAVSHELRTPLAVICSAGENLADGIVNEPEQMRQYGTVVRDEGRRLSEMVEQVLHFAAMRSRRKIYNLQATEIADVIDRALATFEIPIRESGFTVEKRIDQGLPDVIADRSTLVRAVQNLISNALKYGRAGRWLSVRASLVSEGVLISVGDRGPGVSPTDLPHIFDPFYRARSVVDAQIEGSGLGLSLVKQIVEVHHGRVQVDSAPGCGACFSIVVPTSAGSRRVYRRSIGA